jgi:hypothetical protein
LVNVKSPALEPATWTLERLNVALPTLVKVVRNGVLVLPTLWLAKEMFVELKEKPGAGAETTSVLPAPPHDMDHRAMAMQAVARIAAFPRLR